MTAHQETHAGTAFRTVVRIAAEIVLVVAAVTGLSAAAFAWSTTVYDASGTECASAWHFHPGSGYLVHGGELTLAERQAFTAQCDPAGAGPWRTGWLALGTGGGIAVACAAVLVVTRQRPPLVAE
jgi:hypothetical protein